MLVASFPAGPWATNCYVAATAPGEPCLVIDPGKDAAAGVEEVIREHKLTPAAVVLTHGHLDHMWSVLPVCSDHGIPAWIHPSDRFMLADPLAGISADTRAAFEAMTGGGMSFREPDDVRELSDGAVLDIAGVRLLAEHAPGHTQGSVTFRAPAAADRPQIMFSGDVLFAGSIGRTDLPGGSMTAMLDSLARVVLPLDDETVVLPGHGPGTTIGRERVSNPYLMEVAAGVRPVPPPGRGL